MKVPDIFKPSIKSNINNNEEVYYSFNNNKEIYDNKSINNFFSNDNISNKKMLIETKSKKYEAKIVSRVGNNIIMDNGGIVNISDVISISKLQ